MAELEHIVPTFLQLFIIFAFLLIQNMLNFCFPVKMNTFKFFFCFTVAFVKF